ncbi:MAG: hypothetical protein K0M49_02440 [Arenimonas sp.]|nr:hypothetical protein [Rhizobium sp.]MBW8444466.1 hypothetical protein [Arenimonas sp.]
MEELIKYVATVLAFAICLGSSVYLADKGNAAWGWPLVAGVFIIAAGFLP